VEFLPRLPYGMMLLFYSIGVKSQRAISLGHARGGTIQLGRALRRRPAIRKTQGGTDKQNQLVRGTRIQNFTGGTDNLLSASAGCLLACGEFVHGTITGKIYLTGCDI